MRRNFSDDEIQTMKTLAKAGFSTARIGNILKRGTETIRRKMVQLGIARQPRNWKGEKSTAWEGGVALTKEGYRRLYMPEHPFASGNYVLEHRLVMEKMLGRYLLPEEVVHHKDKNKQNNSPENLELFDRNSAHLKNELTGKIPNWSEEGRAKTLAVVRQQRGKKRGKQLPPRPARLSANLQ